MAGPDGALTKKRKPARGALQMDHGYRGETPGYPEYASRAIKDVASTPVDALALSGIPVLSDAAGVASDVNHMYQNPEERNLKNVALLGMGALPFVPSLISRMYKGATPSVPEAPTPPPPVAPKAPRTRKKSPAPTMLSATEMMNAPKPKRSPFGKDWVNPGYLPSDPTINPSQVIPAYRTLRLLPSRPGEMFPAMIGNKAKTGQSIPQDEWLRAQFFPEAAVNKTIKPRKGYHAGEFPHAPQFRGKRADNKGMEPPDMIWTEVDMMADKNYQGQVEQIARDLKKPLYKGELPFGVGPDDGYYRYRNRPDDPPWIISDGVKHKRVMTDEEVFDILRQYGIEPNERFGGNWTPERIKQAGLEAWLK